MEMNICQANKVQNPLIIIVSLKVTNNQDKVKTTMIHLKLIPTQSIVIKGEKTQAREKNRGEEDKILMNQLQQNLNMTCKSKS